MAEPDPRPGAAGGAGAAGTPSPHVCVLSSSAPLGPGDAYSPFILGLAERIQAWGWRTTVLAPHVRGSAEEERLRGVRVRRYRYLPWPSAETLGLGGGMLPGLRRRPLDLLKVPLLLRGQARALRELHADDPIRLLHSHWLLPQGLLGGRFARRREIPHVATAHGSDLLALRFPGSDTALRHAVARSDVVTVNSRAMSQVLSHRSGHSDARLVPIGAREPGPDAVAGNVEFRARVAPGDRVLGYVGRVVEAKGILEFVRVVASLREDDPGAGGLVVGSGGALDEARSLARRLGVEDAVRFLGAVPPERVPAYMSVLDVLVVPSRYEAQGLVAIEAMLLGVPVAAFRTGGLQEVVVDGETGLSVEPGDVEALARAARRLLDDGPLRRRLALAARERATERFTLDAAARRFHRIYRELLAP